MRRSTRTTLVRGVCIALCLAYLAALVCAQSSSTGAGSSAGGGAGGVVAPPKPTEQVDDAQEEQREDEAENVAEHPFLEVYGLLNGSWIKFFVIVVAASRIAIIFPRIGLPLITGYMICGCLCGPYVLGLVTKPQIPDLSYVTQTALAFIAFSAGSELYLPELRSLLRTIALITGFNALFSYFLCTLFIYAIAAGGLIPWMTPYMGSCAFSISLVAGAIMVARSPASAIAVVRELRAKGPATSIMLGVTVVGDVVVLILFTLSNSFALALCGGGGFDGGAFFITLLTLVCAVGLGYGLGFLLIFLLWVPPVRVTATLSIPIPAKFTIIPLGFLIFVLCDWIVVYTEHHWGVGLNFDALLICITAGYVVTNKSQNRVAFLKMLGSAGFVIFTPFFTLVGVSLNLEILVQSIAFGVLVFCCRAICIMIGSYVGGTLAGLDRDKRLKLWMTMLAQAGVSLGLAAEVAVKFPEWGSKFQTTIISVVLINQFAGPVLCKMALKNFGEAGKMAEGEEDEHESHEAGPKKLKRAVIAGVDSTALSVAAKLLKAGWRVTLLDTRKSNLVLAKSLGVPKKDTRSTIDGTKGAAQQAEADEASSLVSESVKVDINEGEASSSSSSHAAAAVTSAGLVEKEPVLDLLLVSGDASVSPSRAFGAALGESEHIDVAIVGLANDQLTYELGAFLARARHCPRVLTRLQNPAWAMVYKDAGLLPVSEFGTMSQTLMASVQSRGNLQFVSATMPLAEALQSLIDPVEDLAHIHLPMSGPERVEYDEAHPAPTAEALQVVSAHLREAGVDAELKVQLLSTVGHGQREEYLDKLHGLHALDQDESGLTEADQEKHANMYLGIAGHAQADSVRAEARKQEAREREAAESAQIDLALGRRSTSPPGQPQDL